MPRPFIPPSRRRRVILPFVALLLFVAVTSPARPASLPGVRGEQGMVVGPERKAAQIGAEVLRSGGNAVDAGVAVAFALTVTYPPAAGVGGGGFLLYRDADAMHHALDFRETAPDDLSPELFLDEDGRPVPGLSLNSGLAVGVPGTVAGLAEAHRRWGSRPWGELLQPAIALARDGFEVYPWLAQNLEDEKQKLLADPEAREIFTRDGTPLRAGQALVQTDLARTLGFVAESGPDAFYSGPVADALVGAVQRAGGVLDQKDLAAYRSHPRKPIEGNYRGHRVVTFPPPSSGGVALLQILTILERYDLRASGAGSSLSTHLMAEAERRAFADRSRWLGDPAFFDVPVTRLLDPRYLAKRAATIRPDRATRSTSLEAGPARDEDSSETLHFSITDSAGRAAGFTITLNQWYGTGIVAPGTGVLLNNEMDDFAIAPGQPNVYGLTGGDANAVDGSKRPLSSMAPTIVEPRGGGARPFLVLGSPGGSTIPTTILQVVVNVIDHEMSIQEAIDAPRFHHQWLPDSITHERGAFPSDVLVNLVSRGHAVEPRDRPLGNVNAIGVDADGAWVGAADPRRRGAAVGF